MTNETPDDRLALTVQFGPPLPPLHARTDGTTVLGRSAACDAILPDAGVSRRHAAIARHAGAWFITDLASRHGTMLNATRLPPNEPAPLQPGDLVQIGPWIFRVRAGGGESRLGIKTDAAPSPGERVEQIAPGNLGSLARQRLSLLIECAAAITGAGTEEELAEAALTAGLAGTGARRAAVVRAGPGDAVQVIRARVPPDDAGPLVFSQSLIRAASGGEVARLTSDQAGIPPDSIVRLGITAALCAPIHLGGAIVAYLYLDARQEESRVLPDAATFCQAVARLCGLALANIKRQDLERRQRQLEADLNAAREAQQLLIPAGHDVLGRVAFSVRMQPGRLVAGDLFDALPLPEGRVGAFIGDVTGEGVGAAILMATAQAQLNAALERFADPAEALMAVNRYLTMHSALDKFVSLWAGVFDPANGRLTYVDAGHGHWMHRPVAGAARRVASVGGPPIGIDPGVRYESGTLDLAPGDRIVVFSDGLVEQQNRGGERFGAERVAAVISASRAPDDDVRLLFEALSRFADGRDLTDDTTVASLELLPP